MVGLRKVRVLIALVVLIGILVIFIAPFVDLEPTALRAWRSALAILLTIVMLSHVIHSFLRAEVFFGTRPERKGRSSRVRHEGRLFKLNCALLC
jgi:hypothetical protein